MDAWEQLVLGSTVSEAGHDAWEHLLSQGGSGRVIIGGELVLEVTDLEYHIELEEPAMEIELVDEAMELVLEDTDYIIEVCDE